MTQCYSFAEISLPWSDARLGFVSDPRPPTFPGRRGVVMPARQLRHTTVRGLLVVPIQAEASELFELSFNTDYSGSNTTIRKVMNNGGNAYPLTGVPRRGVKDTHVYYPDITVCPVTGPMSFNLKRFPPPLVLAAFCEVACPGRPVTQFLGYGPPLQCITTLSRQDSA
ncbi:hypothetical protein F2Q69_00004687 [Brassica cretica]|uniref:Uncharacterized protein n=1 Tax=Brassica cretica TaxID=69181 RepID=A0A8S9PAH0_BRACR|nr:hypothetical protein F2Q69_00004687 [Brassica cretica]